MAENEAHVKVGNIYHVMKESIVPEGYYFNGIKGEAGVYYSLLEIMGYRYHSSLFIEINEDQRDEVEILEQRKQTV